MNGDGVQAVRGDTEAALRELCDLVDAALDESQAGLDGLAEVAAGLKAVYTAAVGAADLARVRTEDILATLAPAPEETAAVDASLLTERGAWTLERMRRRDSVEPSAVAPKPGPALSALPAAKLPYLEQARTVDDVIARFDVRLRGPRAK